MNYYYKSSLIQLSNFLETLGFGALSPALLKMAPSSALFLLTVLAAFFTETSANTFYYDWEKLRTGGLVFFGLLVICAMFVLFWDSCKRFKSSMDHRRGN